MIVEQSSARPFFGWRVVAGAFVLAVFGWGLGFYGPPVYLYAVHEARGWSIALVSAAVTVHYLSGALVVANIAGLYRRFGLPRVTRAGAMLLALGLFGWAAAEAPWQLFVATLLTGCGWVTMGAAAINAIVSPWFVKLRPKALSTAYNGASIGGVIFTPLWVLLIGQFGFPLATIMVGVVTIVIVWWLTASVLGIVPADLRQQPDGEAPQPAGVTATTSRIPPLPGQALWRDWRFRTLAAGMALGLFAQIGLLAHLFSLIIPALGVGWAGVVAGLATASAIAGRTAFGWLMPPGADRRVVAALSYGIQVIGVAILLVSGISSPPLIVLGVILFGFGIGNATSLPPLIAQVEFAKEDTARVVPLIVAMGQAAYAFAPACYGLVRAGTEAGIFGEDSLGTGVFLLTIAVKSLAICAFLGIRQPRPAG